MKRIFLSLLILLYPCISIAQDENEAEEGEALELFDDDAEETSLGWSRMSASVGYMWLDADGTFNVELANGKKVLILDLDRLGVDDDDTSMWFTWNWRSPTSRWGAWFGAWRFDASGYRIWEDQLEPGDGIYIPVGAGVNTTLDTDWYIAEATYSFYRTETLDAGIGFGIHAVDLGASLKGRLEVGEQGVELYDEKLEFLAPLPNILAYSYWKFAERWRLTTRFGWFGLSYDDYSGGMVNLHALLRYDLSERWALEAGYQFVKLDIDVEKGDRTQLYDVDFSGPMAVIRFNKIGRASCRERV